MADEISRLNQAEPEPADEGQEHSGGGRFNRRLFYVVLAVLITVGVVGMHGLVRRA